MKTQGNTSHRRHHAQERELELALELLADNPNLKVVYMSGFISRDQAMREIIGKTGVFIQKPFDPDDLVRVVDELILGTSEGRENAA